MCGLFCKLSVSGLPTDKQHASRSGECNKYISTVLV